jgi:hypothetical protein
MAEGIDASRGDEVLQRLDSDGVVHDGFYLPAAVPTGERLIAWAPLATHPPRLEFATVPVRSSPAVETLGAEVRVVFLRLPAVPPSCS